MGAGRMNRRGVAGVFLMALLVLTGCDELRGMDDGQGALGGTPAIPVRQAQAGLTALGYAVGPVDGVLGPRTSAAVARFRDRQGLPAKPSGVAGIDRAFADDLAERLAFDGLAWRRRARAVAARQPEPPQEPAAGERDAALEDLLSRYETESGGTSGAGLQ
ncbi:MAG: peptidoglycan-binding domain-containing protein [Pseudomonadota bacterium]